jgi:hypothetical protein
MVQIRKAKPEDFADLLVLFRQLWPTKQLDEKRLRGGKGRQSLLSVRQSGLRSRPIRSAQESLPLLSPDNAPVTKKGPVRNLVSASRDSYAMKPFSAEETDTWTRRYRVE